METLVKGALALGVKLSQGQVDEFSLYLDGLGEWNRHISLTSAKALANAEEVHFLDSLTLVPSIKSHLQHQQGNLIDVGSGAGFPGIPPHEK